MSSLNNPKQLQNIKDVQEFMRYCSQSVNDIQSVINGQIEFGSNIKSQTVVEYFDQANVDKQILHNLNKANVNFIIVNKTAASDFYHSTNKDLINTINLRSTVAGVTATIVLY